MSVEPIRPEDHSFYGGSSVLPDQGVDMWHEALNEAIHQTFERDDHGIKALMAAYPEEAARKGPPTAPNLFSGETRLNAGRQRGTFSQSESGISASALFTGVHRDSVDVAEKWTRGAAV